MKSHKTRLFLITTAWVGLILALLFLAIVAGVRGQVLAHKEFEMRLAVRTARLDDNGRIRIDVFRRSYPGYSIGMFDLSGKLLSSSGPLKLSFVEGFVVRDEYVELGVQRGDEQVVVGSGWTAPEQGLDALGAILAALWLPLTLLVGGATWLGAQSVFRPLERMSHQAAAISGSNRSERIAIQDRAEFGEFAAQLNQMLERIEQTRTREEEFASDAAHELRTPLAILRMRIETTLLKERQPTEYVKSLMAMLEEIGSLTQMIESLLQTARSQSVVADPIELEPVVWESVSRWEDTFRSKGVRIETTAEPVRAAILPEELRIILDNLMSNALRFSPDGGLVRVDLYRESNEAVLTVIDEGLGIPEEVRERVFDRFYRAESSRNRESGGAGVGLAVCKKILELRSGAIRVKDTEMGTCIECRLPADVG